MKIGYARVSTSDQNLTLQLAALEAAQCQRVFQEKASGATAHRPELMRLLEQLRALDTVVVWKLDRLARSTRDLLNLMEIFRSKEVAFQSLSEPWADTTTQAGKMMMTIFAGIAEFERGLIQERTQTGRLLAKQRGIKFGRPSKLTLEQRQLAVRLLQEGKSVREVAKMFQIHPATLYRFITPSQTAID